MRLPLAATLVLIVAMSAEVSAQASGSLDSVKALVTPTLKNKIVIYYSPGYEARAKEILPMIEKAMSFYEKKLKLKMDLSIAVLDREQWEKVAKAPYGMPHVSASPHVAFLPATPDGVIAQAIMQVKPFVGKDTTDRLGKLGFTYEKATNKLVDLIGLHELGHTYANSLGLEPGTPNKWFAEMFASYFAYAFLHEKEPKLAKVFEIMTAGTASIGPKPKYTTLDDFEELYSRVGDANYNWYQGQFMGQVIAVYAKSGRDFIPRVAKAFEGDNGPMPIDVVAERLDKISPGILAWTKQRRRP
jgi:hypothetical protein